MPVIIEDDVFVGGGCGVYEGTDQAASSDRGGDSAHRITPVYDLVNGTIIKPSAGPSARDSAGAVVVPGARAVKVGAGEDWGLSLATPVIVKYRDDKTDARTELEQWIGETGIRDQGQGSGLSR